MAVTFPQVSDDMLQGNSTVKWNPSSTDSPGSCAADAYVVGYQLIDKDQCLEVADSPIDMYGSVNTTEVTLTGLIPYSTYKIYVTARNGEGDADPSSKDFTTPAEGECIHFQETMPSCQLWFTLQTHFKISALSYMPLYFHKSIFVQEPIFE